MPDAWGHPPSEPLVWLVTENGSNDAGIRIRPGLINHVQNFVVVASGLVERASSLNSQDFPSIRFENFRHFLLCRLWGVSPRDDIRKAFRIARRQVARFDYDFCGDDPKLLRSPSCATWCCSIDSTVEAQVPSRMGYLS